LQLSTAHKLGQLGDVHGDPARLIARARLSLPTVVLSENVRDKFTGQQQHNRGR
jgi:hypothetical protein